MIDFEVIGKTAVAVLSVIGLAAVIRAVVIAISCFVGDEDDDAPPV